MSTLTDLTIPRGNRWRRIATTAPAKSWAIISRKPIGSAGAFIFLVMIILAVFSGQLATHAPNKQDASDRLQPPSLAHFMGTDEAGRDVWSRVVYGARVSLYVGIVSVVLATVAGTALGMTSGFIGGRTDIIVQRVVEMFLAFPTLILALVIMAILGPSVNNLIFAVVMVLTPRFSRVVRGSALATKEEPYIDAARSIGAKPVRILARHLLPNILAPIIVLASTNLGIIMFIEASLSFLGFGTPPPTPSWGRMLSGTASGYFQIAWWLAFFPGLVLSMAILGVNLLGDALRDIWDPRLRGR
jgi:peptide/nickel transport system permease protein